MVPETHSVPTTFWEMPPDTNALSALPPHHLVVRVRSATRMQANPTWFTPLAVYTVGNQISLSTASYQPVDCSLVCIVKDGEPEVSRYGHVPLHLTPVRLKQSILGLLPLPL